MNISYSSIVGALIREERMFREISQRDMGVDIDVAQSTINRVENGHGHTTEVLGKVCDYFQVTLSTLFSRADRRAEALRKQGVNVSYKYAPTEATSEKWVTTVNSVTKVCCEAVRKQFGVEDEVGIPKLDF